VQFIDRRGVLAYCVTATNEAAPLGLGDERGAVFGTLFPTATPGAGRVAGFDAGAIASLVDSGGGSMMRDFWGAWTAFIHDRGTDNLYVLRDPTGAGPIYEGGTEQVRVICTHVLDYIRMVGNCSADIEVLAASIVSPSLITPRTAIEGLTELFPGERLTLPREGAFARRELLWRPAANATEITREEFGSAATQLRETIVNCARSWSQEMLPIVHRLSGGLDSSIVLTALRSVRSSEIVAINEYSADAPEGDERAIARIVAAKCGAPFIAVEMSPEHVDWTRLLSLELGARPMRQTLSLADTTIVDAIAAIHPNAMVTSGQGGDQVFHRSHLPYIAADAYADGLRWRDVMRITLDTARLGRRNVWDVLGVVARHGLLRCSLPAGGAAARVLLFDGGEGAAAARKLDSAHPWAGELRKSSPARALRIGLVADLQNYRQRDAISSRFAKAQILASQPIVELCLRVPPYVMTHGGRDRALVRAAFSDALPREVLARVGKGATTRYHAAVVQKHFSLMRDMLSGGETEKRGLVNGDALRSAFELGEVTSAPQSAALLSCFLVELWLRQFAQAIRNARCDNSAAAHGAGSC